MQSCYVQNMVRIFTTRVQTVNLYDLCVYVKNTLNPPVS